MEYLPIDVPQSAVRDLVNQIISPEEQISSEIELAISIDDKNVNVREFGAYLSLLDRIYGRLQQKGIYSYSHRRDMQISVETFRKGSLEIVISDIISKVDPTTLVIVWLVLKYLPAGIRELVSTYKNYEEARLARINRKQIKEKMEKDKLLQELDSGRINQLVTIVDYFIKQENRKLAAPVRFARNFVKQINLRIRKKGEETD